VAGTGVFAGDSTAENSAPDATMPTAFPDVWALIGHYLLNDLASLSALLD